MSRFNTGNPLGSNDPRDLDDNAKNMDLAVNSEDSQWIDRFGRPRLPLMEQERQFVAAQERHEDEFQSAQESREDRFNDFIASSGYQFVGDYGPGIEITEYNQLIRDSNGEFWRVSGQVELPYTTTGAGIPEDDALVPAGDAVLRQDLADPDKGAAMVARGVVAVDSIADLLALPEGQRKEGLRYLVKGYHAGSDVGGGEFYYDSSRAGESDGGTVLDGFVRIGVECGVYVSFFGAKGGEVDDTAAWELALSSGHPCIIGMLNDAHVISEPLYIPNSVRKIDLNSSRLVFTWEQQGAADSLFYSDNRTAPLFIKGGEMEYVGQFDHGGPYNGRVCGVSIRATTSFSGLFFHNIEVYGFNRAGIQVAQGGEYISAVIISECRLHHNRVAGAWYGNVDGLIFRGNTCTYNGIDSDARTGYGCAGISEFYPKNITIDGNHCNFNYRKGIDFHSGYNITITNNHCIGNRYYGIYVIPQNNLGGTVDPMPIGSVTIAGNTVVGELYDPDHISRWNYIAGIHVGSYLPQTIEDGTSPTKIVLTGNVVDISGSALEVYPIQLSMGAVAEGYANLTGNTIISKQCSAGIMVFGPQDTDPRRFFDISIVGGQFSVVGDRYIRVHQNCAFNLRSLQISGGTGFLRMGSILSQPVQLPLKEYRPKSIIRIDGVIWDTNSITGPIFPLDGAGIYHSDVCMNGGLWPDYNGKYRTMHDYIDGDYRAGDRVYYDEPTDYIGAICTTQGTRARNEWQAETHYEVGQFVRTSSSRALLCTKGGTSSTSEPAGLVYGQTVTDGGVSWLVRSTAPSFREFGALA